jgi:thiamine biosynthesis lipoprotein
MGTDCHILVVAARTSDADGLAQLAQHRVSLLEACWSRFRSDSELSRLNARAGRGPVAASGDLLALVERMVEAWHRSDGLFDPTVLTSMIRLGYDRDFAEVRHGAGPASVSLAPAPGMGEVVVDAGTVSLPVGVGLDPGAIGKGLAADTVAEEILAAGAIGVLVNLGGDLAVRGATQDGEPWRVGVEDERRASDDPRRMLTVLHLDDGASDGARFGVATSTTRTRRWARGQRHHVIDPRTGTMSDGPLVQVTVLADEAWRAEVAATTAMLLPTGEAVAHLRRHGMSGVLLEPDHCIDLTAQEARHG